MGNEGRIFTEDSHQVFTITVEKTRGIPGFPIATTLIGLATIIHKKKQS